MDKYDKIIFDFDDTIWSRDSKDLECSIFNAKFIEKYLSDKSIIISGNSYESIKNKLDKYNIHFPIVWADANSIEYCDGKYSRVIPKCKISDTSVEIVCSFLTNKYNFTPKLVGYENNITNIKIKPITPDFSRDIVIDYLNNYIFRLFNITDCYAKKAGKTTVDILSVYNSKNIVYNYIELNKYKTLFIGDEIKYGNDKDIASLCTDYIVVNNVYDTKKVLEGMVV